MKNLSIFFSLSTVTILLFTGFSTRTLSDAPGTLYDSIVAMDAMWEDAYNNCKMDVMEEIISEDLEFYHVTIKRRQVPDLTSQNLFISGRETTVNGE